MNSFVDFLTSRPWVILFAGFLAFILLREILTWYWKVNKIVNLLEKIEENTRPKNIEKKVEVTDKNINL